jgi:signal transduction histidine kinase
MNVPLARTVWDIISTGRAYLVTDNLARLLPSGDRNPAPRADLRDLIAERDRLESEVLDIADGERQRIGSELHDDLGQLLAAIALLTTDLESTLAHEGSPLVRAARKIREVVELAIDRTSRLAGGLATIDLDGEQLVRALHALGAETRHLFGVACRVRAEDEIPSLEPTTAHHLYKIAQEAVTNAVKHGQGSEVEIALTFRCGELILTVRNDGVPFAAPVADGRMGLRYMRYRASVIGATLELGAAAAGGTVVRCALRVDSASR